MGIDDMDALICVWTVFMFVLSFKVVFVCNQFLLVPDFVYRVQDKLNII